MFAIYNNLINDSQQLSAQRLLGNAKSFYFALGLLVRSILGAAHSRGWIEKSLRYIRAPFALGVSVGGPLLLHNLHTLFHGPSHKNCAGDVDASLPNLDRYLHGPHLPLAIRNIAYHARRASIWAAQYCGEKLPDVGHARGPLGLCHLHLKHDLPFGAFLPTWNVCFLYTRLLQGLV